MAGSKKRNSEKEFWRKVKKSQTCWIWTGERTAKGYGIFYINNGKIRAHRYSYMLAHGITDLGDSLILHKCDNPSCVRPSHLFAGTSQDNALDMVKKERHGSSKLSRKDYRSILVDKRTYDEIAEAYGITPTTVSCIKCGKIGAWATSDMLLGRRHIRLTDNQRAAILLDKRKTRIIAATYGVSTKTILRIRQST